MTLARSCDDSLLADSLRYDLRNAYAAWHTPHACITSECVFTLAWLAKRSGIDDLARIGEHIVSELEANPDRKTVASYSASDDNRYTARGQAAAAALFEDGEDSTPLLVENP